MRLRVAVAALLIAAPAAGSAQVAVAQVTITGQVQQATSYSAEQLASMPAVEVQGAREGGATSTYAGPVLWPLVEAAKPIDGPDRGAHLQHVLLARGADGYAVALALGEIDPGFEGKHIIIATKQDGAPLPAPRLVVPGDHRAGRNVRELVAIEVR